jgi:hypothetical protein
MPKGFLKASRKFLQGIEKLLGNALIPAISQQERRWNRPAAVSQKRCNFGSFPLKPCTSVYINKKS